MINLLELVKPKENLDLEDGSQMLSDANIALDAIGKKLKIMAKLAKFAADPKCDKIKRMEMNLLFKKLGREIDDWANINTGGIQLLNAPLHKGQ